ncbi:hypothetical protein D3C73_913400 [compost metagenome]
MRDNQLVLDQGVAVQQEGVAGIGVNDKLIDFTESKIILRLHLVERLAEAPVPEPGRHPVSTERINDVCGAYFITHRIKIQPKPGSNLRNFGNRPFQRLNLISGHESISPSSLGLCCN